MILGYIDGYVNGHSETKILNIIPKLIDLIQPAYIQGLFSSNFSPGFILALWLPDTNYKLYSA